MIRRKIKPNAKKSPYRAPSILEQTKRVLAGKTAHPNDEHFIRKPSKKKKDPLKVVRKR